MLEKLTSATTPASRQDRDKTQHTEIHAQSFVYSGDFQQLLLITSRELPLVFTLAPSHDFVHTTSQDRQRVSPTWVSKVGAVQK